MNEHEKKLEVPRLSQEVKKLNGRSGKKLSRCIDTLCEVLDDDISPKMVKNDRAEDCVPKNDE